MIALLGRGGSGRVHLAWDRALGREVAVKTLDPRSRTRWSRAGFLREASTHLTLDVPGVVKALDFDVGRDGEPRLVLEPVRGARSTRL